MVRLAGRNKATKKAVNVAGIQTTAVDATVAAGATPTKVEFDKVVTLVNELKADHNSLVTAIKQ